MINSTLCRWFFVFAMVMCTALLPEIGLAGKASELNGCVVTPGFTGTLFLAPKNGLFGNYEKSNHQFAADQRFYVVSGGTGYYHLFLGYDFLKVVSVDDVTVNGFVVFDSGAYEAGKTAVTIESCGGTYGLSKRQ